MDEKQVKALTGLSIEECIDRQTPKVPDLEGDGYCDGTLIYDTWICPNCDKKYEVYYDNYDYCPKCGQRIKHMLDT